MKKKRVAVLVLTMAMLAGEAMGAAGCGAKETQTEQAAEGTEAALSYVVLFRRENISQTYSVHLW